MEKKFVDGIGVYLPHENAPEFVKYNLSIKPKKLIAFLKENKDAMTEKGYFRVDIKVSKNGNHYAELNDWKPETNHHNPEVSHEF